MFGKIKISKRVLTAALALSLILTASAAGLCTAAAEDETATPTYTLFGKEIAYTLAEEGAEDGIKLSDETLSGLPVIESISDDFYTLTLNKEGTGYKNIKLSYKFKEPNLSDKAKHTSNIWGPVIAQLCKTESNVYSFGQSYWAQGDMTFIGSKEGQIREQWGGKGSEKWHSVDFTVYENRFSIIYDGICWYRGDLKSAAPKGDIALVLGYAGTKIADVKVFESRACDVAAITNVDYSVDAYSAFPLTAKGTYNSEEQAYVYNLAWEEDAPTNFGNLSGWTIGAGACKLKDFEIEMKLKFTGVSWNHGIILALPGGEKIGMQQSRIFNHLTGQVYSGSGIGLDEYKTVKIICKGNTLSMYLNGTQLFTTDANPDRESGVIRFGRYGQNGQVSIKSIKITDISETRDSIKAVDLDHFEDGTMLDRNWSGAWSETQYSAATVAGRKAAMLANIGNNGTSWFRHEVDYDDNRAFKASFYIDGSVANDSEEVLMTFSLNNIDINIYKTQMRVVCGGNNWYNYAATFGADYSPYDRWVDMELIYAGERVILNYDGKQFVYSGANISADTETTDKVDVYATNSRLGKISFADIAYEKTDTLAGAMAAIDGIGEVAATDESTGLIDAAYNAYEALARYEKKNVVNYATLTAAVGSYKSLTGGADVSLNGSTDLLDLIALKKVTAGTRDKNFMCDLNGDGSVTAADLVACRKVLLSR